MIAVNSFQIDPMYTDIKENCIVSKLLLFDSPERRRQFEFGNYRFESGEHIAKIQWQSGNQTHKSYGKQC